MRGRTFSESGTRKTGTTARKSGNQNLARVEPGSQVWIPDMENGVVWLKAEVQSIDTTKNVVAVRTDDGLERTIAGIDRLLLCNTKIWGAGGLTSVNDLSALTHLHEPEVLQALQLRFDVDSIYTFCGPILIAMNPFKRIKDLYDDPMATKYKNQGAPPHVYTTAQTAFHGLTNNRQPQVILISGESGAGKTETMKHALKVVTEKAAGAVVAAAGEKSSEQKVLDSNGVLEAFGNACTVRNRNSSRFGKFIEMLYEAKDRSEPEFVCAKINTYLLEKIRITEMLKKERSYHIFYQVCAAKERWGDEYQGLPLHYFGDPSSFGYLRRSDTFQLQGVDDSKVFEETLESMKDMGFLLDEQITIIKVVAAVMHIGSLEISDKGDGTCEIDESNGSFAVVCEVLGIDLPQLNKALTHRLISVSGTEKYETPLNVKQIEERRESFARSVYSLMFNLIVHRVNRCLSESSKKPANSTFIGVLDIFGFEHFETNSFEQLCINFANERLQQLFNQFVFKAEMEIYKKEGIPCESIEFPDNQDIIDLIQDKKLSIFSLLDEECRMPQGSDQKFSQKVCKTFEKHKRFKFEPRKPTSFTIIHFAGAVSYNTAHFLDKNIDELGELLKRALNSSSQPFIAGLLDLQAQLASEAAAASSAKAPAPGRGPSKLKPNTVSFDFKSQLENLMSKLASAAPHFVRCIKPNPQNRPDCFNRLTVVEQLRSGGVIEALHVQRAGFPCRASHKNCWQDIAIMFKAARRAEYEKSDIEKRLQEALGNLAKELKWPAASEQYALGSTTVFFKQSAYEILECARLTVQNTAAKSIQGTFRRHRMYKMFLGIRSACCKVQAAVRKYLQRCKLWREMTDAQKRKTKLFNVQFEDKAEIVQPDEEDEEEDEEDAEEKQRQLEEERAQEAEKLRLEMEAEARRIEEAKQGALEEERRRAEMERERVEKQRQEEQKKMQREFEDKIQELKLEAMNAKEAEAHSRQKYEVELERVRHDGDVRKAEIEQQLTLAQLKENEVKSRIAELEEENKKLREKNAADLEAHRSELSDLQDQHRIALAKSVEAQDTIREQYIKQMEEMRENLDETHRKQEEEAKTLELDRTARFQEEVTRLREREGEQRRKHQEDLMQMRLKETERQKKWQADVAQCSRSTSNQTLQIRALEARIADQREDFDQQRSLMEAQNEELKRLHTMEIEMLTARASEKENELAAELDMVQKQREEQVASLRRQLEFQKQELTSTCHQEVEMVKKQLDQRERSLMQMLEQARLGQAEKEKTLDMQLALKATQQSEHHRAAEARAKHLEESARRQQEMYEEHVSQLTRQMRESQEGFRRQLQDAQDLNDKRLAETVTELSQMEDKLKKERQQVLQSAQEQMEKARKMKEHMNDLAYRAEKAGEYQLENRELKKRIEKLQAEISGGKSLKKARRDAAQEGSTTPRGNFQPARRYTEPGFSMPEQLRRNSLQGTSRGKENARLSLAPQKLLQRRKTWVAASANSVAGAAIKAISPAMPQITLRQLEEGKRPRAAAQVVPMSARASAKLLRPTLRQGGKACTGEVRLWREFSAGPRSDRPSDSAVTALCFSSPNKEASFWVLAAACKSGIVSLHHVRRTPLERDSEAAPTEEDRRSQDTEQVLQFQAHAKAITFMCFSNGTEYLVTTSSDWTARFWNPKDGKLLRQIDDSSLVVAAVPLASPPGSFVLANANAILRLVEPDGSQQKVRLDNYARALALGLDGSRVLAATSRGWIHALAVGSGTALQIVGSQSIGQAALTSLTIAPCPDGMPPMVAVNSMDGTVCILQSNANLTNFTVLRRLPNPHRLLPLRCCHVASSVGNVTGEAGFIASGSEDGNIRVFELDSLTEQKLIAHDVPVVDVAVAPGGGLLASGDVHGRIILWRRGSRSTVAMPNGI